MLRLKEYFSNPDEYIPERWMRGNPLQAQVHPYLLTPFSFGPRMCIGKDGMSICCIILYFYIEMY